MRRVIILVFLSMYFLAAGCAGPSVVGEPIQITLTPSVLIVSPEDHPETGEPIVEKTNTVVPLETLEDPVGLPTEEGAQIPSQMDLISAQSVSALQELTRWEAGFVNALSFSPDGRYLVIGLGDYWEGEESFGTRVVDVSDGALVIETDGYSGAVIGVDVSPNGEVLAASAEDGWLYLWGLFDGASLAQLEHPGYITGAVFSPVCRLENYCELAVGLNDPQHWGQAYIWNLFNLDTPGAGDIPEHTAVLIEKYGRVNCLDYSPDGEYLATGSKGIIRVWRSVDEKAVLSLEESPGMVTALAFSPDGRFLAAGTERGELLVWQAGQQGKEGFGDFLGRMIGETAGITGLEFTQDGTLLLSANETALLQAWHTEALQSDRGNMSLESVFEADLGGGSITSMAISPSGDLLALGVEDLYQPVGMVALWGIPVVK